MFTNNFQRLFTAIGNLYDSDSWGYLYVISTTNTRIYPSYKCYNNRADAYNGLPFSGNIVLGDSNAAEDIEQYCIQGNEITFTDTSLRMLFSNNKDSIEVSYIFTGTPTANATIKEMALYKPIYVGGNNAGNSMIYREVLDEPIDVVANETITLQFTIKLKIT